MLAPWLLHGQTSRLPGQTQRLPGLTPPMGLMGLDPTHAFLIHRTIRNEPTSTPPQGPWALSVAQLETSSLQKYNTIDYGLVEKKTPPPQLEA